MAPRCSSTSTLFLPFLYPSLYSARATVPRLLSRPCDRRTNSTDTSTNSAAPEFGSRLNPAPDDFSMPNFADKAKLMLYAGGGGHGCISFLREAYMADGPANGGDGGHGGNIYIQAVHGETSLHKLARRRFIRAGKGKSGQGDNQGGRKGDDIIIVVPVGTIVKELERNDPVAEERFLSRRQKWQRDKKKRQAAAARLEAAEAAAEEGENEAFGEPDEPEDPDRDQWLLYPGCSSSEAKRIVLPRLPHRERLYAQPPAPIHLDLSRPTPRPILLAAGGIGGLGNPHFVSRERPKPLFATKGEDAISLQIELELKLLADVGLVGLPNAGKSTLLRAMSNSRTRVGNWAFTTLQPNVGTVVLDNNKGRPLVTSFRREQPSENDDPYGVSDNSEPELQVRTRFTVADIPGLIEGAHMDKGLGIAFLRHVERAGVLAFVIDLNAGNAVRALKALWNEVGLYAKMREDEEAEREREARIEWDPEAGTGMPRDADGDQMIFSDTFAPPASPTGLHIAGKPWFVIATKGDLPDTQENFAELREYLASVTRGDVPHPSGVEGAWTENCTAIPVSAINGHGVDRVVHWTVGLLDG
ncbi:GTP-binding protein Obg/CgtA [Coniochaeta ligniaria NRRL 30616]|uniref:GTP-binding protein Obg/CgtA n=1 Tax=Coniochaeta ligniaria NRRL 30616 TaxID=1408157 RepID=A0A1J7IY85_9PEZI|nr:GTP-binding protein Obg/CgtA [Coniochaeta ligniaria NRRL 30616]